MFKKKWFKKKNFTWW